MERCDAEGEEEPAWPSRSCLLSLLAAPTAKCALDTADACAVEALTLRGLRTDSSLASVLSKHARRAGSRGGARGFLISCATSGVVIRSHVICSLSSHSCWTPTCGGSHSFVASGHLQAMQKRRSGSCASVPHTQPVRGEQLICCFAVLQKRGPLPKGRRQPRPLEPVAFMLRAQYRTPSS